MASHPLTIDLGAGDRVSAVLAGPGGSSPSTRTGVIIAHGAGNDMHTPLIAAVAERLADGGFPTLRFNFRYRERGLKSPDAPARLEHAWQCAWQCMRDNPHHPVDRIVAAGKSMGGRVASQMVAAGSLDAAGLILLGYPLHAPGRTDRLRDAHLYRIRIPMRFFAGTRDRLCDLGRLRAVLAGLRAPHELDVVDGGDHSFNLPRAADRPAAAVIQGIADRCLAWIQQLP